MLCSHTCGLTFVCCAACRFATNERTTTEWRVRPKDNINPIKRVEASGLIMASTIFGVPAPALVKDAHQQRIADAELSANDATAVLPSSD